MDHYDIIAIQTLYRMAWGPSIHFGFYPNGNETIEDAVEITKRRLADRAELTGISKVLEVGSGEGETARWLARQTGCHVTATNFAKSQLISAQKKTAASGLSHLVTHQWADYQDLPYENNSFDIHWSQEAFVHCQDKSRYFSEAFRVLNRQGKLVLSEQVTNRDLCTKEELTILKGRHGSADLWDSVDMSMATQKAGFVDIYIEDWSPHMARHFKNLVHRIESDLDNFIHHIGEEILFSNLNLWKSAVLAANEGKIGWCFLTARKPG